MNKTLFIGNLKKDVTETDIRSLISHVGTVNDIKLIRDSQTNESKGFGFIEMENENDAEKTITELNGSDFKGNPVIIVGGKSIPENL